MNDIQVKCFIESARCKSFSEAAKLLFLSQPTVSRNISELEKEWNIRLFVRQGGKAELTEAGRRMAEFCEFELMRFNEKLSDVRRLGGGGELCIALLNGQMINSILRGAILKMKKEHPEIQVGMQRFDYNEIRDQLILKKSDVAELPQDTINFKNIKSSAYCQYETFLVIPEASPFAYKKNLSIKDFVKENLISVEKKECAPAPYELLWNEKCAEYGVEPRLTLVSDIKQQEMMVELGEGVAICNINHMMTNSPHTKFVRLKEFKPTPFELVWNAENKNPALEVFLKCMDFRPDEII